MTPKERKAVKELCEKAYWRGYQDQRNLWVDLIQSRVTSMCTSIKSVSTRRDRLPERDIDRYTCAFEIVSNLGIEK